MVWPLFFMYMLSNMLFQIIVINSFRLDESRMTAEKIWGQNSSHWYDAITLAHFGVVWYLNPLLWALIFGALQAFSHVCEGMYVTKFRFWRMLMTNVASCRQMTLTAYRELTGCFNASLFIVFLDKLPPRVSQTAHWLDLTTILKQNGYVHFALILLSQTFFGTLNEVGTLYHHWAFLFWKPETWYILCHKWKHYEVTPRPPVSPQFRTNYKSDLEEKLGVYSLPPPGQ